jgi:perosamine synthetase
MTKPIPMSSPDISQADVDAVMEVLRTPYLSRGPRIEEFETRICAYLGARHACAVSCGTSGLHLCVIAAGVRDGDFVITTPFSFVASANSILYEHGVPIFVDVDPFTGNIDAARVVEAVDDLTAGGAAAARWMPRKRSSRASSGELRAVLPVHTFGQPADMDPIVEAARRSHVVVIEDACEAIGATYRGRNAGTLGDAAVFAFYPNKQMTTGEGGMIVTGRQEWNELFRSLRNQGRDPGDDWLSHSRLGFNYRLDELSAALGVAQLLRLEELLERRARVAAWYTERLRAVTGIGCPVAVGSTTRRSWFVYVIRLTGVIDRRSVMAALASHGVESRPYFSPIHLQPFYRSTFGYLPGDFPIAERLGATSLALPFSGVMTEDDVDRVCHALEKSVKE